MLNLLYYFCCLWGNIAMSPYQCKPWNSSWTRQKLFSEESWISSYSPGRSVSFHFQAHWQICEKLMVAWKCVSVPLSVTTEQEVPA